MLERTAAAIAEAVIVILVAIPVASAGNVEAWIMVAV